MPNLTSATNMATRSVRRRSCRVNGIAGKADKRYALKKSRPTENSIRKSRLGISFLQYLHLPPSSKNDTSGIKSNAESVLWQESHSDLPKRNDFPQTVLETKTSIKLPKTLPTVKMKKYNMNTFIILIIAGIYFLQKRF